MIVAFPEPHAPKEKSHPIFFCPLGSLDTVYTAVISKNQFAYVTLRAWTIINYHRFLIGSMG